MAGPNPLTGIVFGRVFTVAFVLPCRSPRSGWLCFSAVFRRWRAAFERRRLRRIPEGQLYGHSSSFAARCITICCWLGSITPPPWPEPSPGCTLWMLGVRAMLPPICPTWNGLMQSRDEDVRHVPSDAADPPATCVSSLACRTATLVEKQIPADPCRRLAQDPEPPCVSTARSTDKSPEFGWGVLLERTCSRPALADPAIAHLCAETGPRLLALFKQRAVRPLACSTSSNTSGLPLPEAGGCASQQLSRVDPAAARGRQPPSFRRRPSPRRSGALGPSLPPTGPAARSCSGTPGPEFSLRLW